MKILLFYDKTQTFTNTVFEHLNSFAKYSSHEYYFCHNIKNNIPELSSFDAIIIHYSIRLAFDALNPEIVCRLKDYSGLKVLFIQDEYDNTKRVWHWINYLGINLVFTVVPENNIQQVYPSEIMPKTKFVSNLTGYVPEEFSTVQTNLAPSAREIVFGYRGRPLPIRYGALGKEKIQVGQLVKNYCKQNNIQHNIEWTEDTRIYGPAWYEFMSSCRTMLGSESGSNVFDWDGTLNGQIKEYKHQNPSATDDEIYDAVISTHDQHGLMNQISPRVFESIALKTVLVLFEGEYSNILIPGTHYIPLKKDGSNLDEIFKMVSDNSFVDCISERAYEDIIASEKYGYRSFVAMIDSELLNSFNQLAKDKRQEPHEIDLLIQHPEISKNPVRSTPPPKAVYKILEPRNLNDLMLQKLYNIWVKMPSVFKNTLRPAVRVFIKQ